jgi:hypothetical protein
MRSSVLAAFLLLGTAAAVPAVAQDRPADNMQVLVEKIRADKKLLVAENMGLTEAEAKAFWPIYEEYQKGLMEQNGRLGQLIQRYAATKGNVSDADANAMMDEYLSIEKARLAQLETFRPRFAKILPAPKVARYFQIETKIRSVIHYQLAESIPLM